MTNKIDDAEIIGKKHSLLTIQKVWRNSKKELVVRCLCDCGRGYQGTYYRIKAGYIRSCGCATAKRKGNEAWRKFCINPLAKNRDKLNA